MTKLIAIPFALALAAVAVRPSDARACAYIPDAPPCGDLAFSATLGSAICFELVQSDTGSFTTMFSCHDGEDTSGAFSGGGGYIVGLTLEVDGSLVKGSVSTKGPTSSRPVVLVHPSKGILIVRDWGSGIDLYQLRKAQLDGTPQNHKLALVGLDGAGRVALRYPLTGCVAAGWSLQPGPADPLLEVTNLDCDLPRAPVIRRFFRSVLGAPTAAQLAQDAQDAQAAPND